MTFNESTQKPALGAKFFAVFIAIGLIVGALGGTGLYALSAAGKLVSDTYDRPVMAIDHARSASLAFAQIDKEWLQRSLVKPSERRDFDRRIDSLSEELFADLAMVDDRALANSERTAILRIRDLFAQWSDLRRAESKPDATKEIKAVAGQITQRFEVLTELIAGHTFAERRKALRSINRHKYIGFAALGVALLLSAILAFILARRGAARPLSAATTVDRPAQSRLAAAIENAREGVVLIDGTNRIVIANKQVGAFFPAVATQVTAGSDFTAAANLMRESFIDPISGAGVIPAWEAVNGGEPDPDTTLRGEHQLADGRWIRFSRNPTDDGGFLLLLSDVTEVKAHDRETQRQAQDASRARTRFLTNVSHELRASLDAIIGPAEAMADQMFGKIGNKQYVEYAGDIVQNSRRLMDVIDSVLDLARSDVGQLQLQPRVVDIAEIIDDCVASAREQCTRAQLKFHVLRPEDPLLVFGEPAKLRQIVLNLLSNAVKFTDPGGEVSLLAVRTVDEQAKIRIVDTGIGMAAEGIPAALTPFGQTEPRPARRYDGTGLGLPLTKVLVDLHGGKLKIKSTPGEGTTVIVSLPIYRERWDALPSKATAA